MQHNKINSERIFFLEATVRVTAMLNAAGIYIPMRSGLFSYEDTPRFEPFHSIWKNRKLSLTFHPYKKLKSIESF